MDLDAASSGSMSKKKAPKDAFHGPAGSSFTQKKKVILENVKHSGNKQDISLKSDSGNSVFSNVESLSDNENDVDMSGGGNGSLLDSAVNTPRANRLSTGIDFGSSLSSPNFVIDEKSMRKAGSLAKKEEIIVNNNVRKQGLCSDQIVVIKEILMNTPKNMIIAATVQLASRWLFLIEKDLIHVAMAVRDHNTWTSKDWFKALLFTLPVGTTAHDLGMLLDGARGKTCVINRSLETGNWFYCAVVCFESDKMLESAFYTKPIFGGVQLSWARLELVWCDRCGHFRYLALECNVSDVLPFVPPNLMKRPSFGTSHFQLAKLYARKNVPISRPAVFGGKLWAQVVSFASPFGSSLSGSGLLSDDDHLAVLKQSMEILSNQVSVILRKLSSFELVPLASPSCAPFLAVSVHSAPVVDSNIALDGVLASSTPSLSGGNDSAAVFSSSGSKVLTSKLGGLEFKMSDLEALFSSILARLDLLCFA
ncbi:hypothetical protein G9A89_022633 [Geosiphon pyriformis]|nr:hypothetical protein G9A89_022633 [Geosiphon pyriformis]